MIFKPKSCGTINIEISGGSVLLIFAVAAPRIVTKDTLETVHAAHVELNFEMCIRICT